VAGRTARGNAGWQHDLSVSHERIGDLLRDQGNLPAALQSYEAALPIFERLVKADPIDTGWQSRLSASLSRIGAVHYAQRNFAGALESYRAPLAIHQRPASTDATNIDWQNLANAHGNIAGVLHARGDRKGALASWRQALLAAETNAAGAEAAETKSGGKPRAKTAGALGELAWHVLFAREFKTALAASERARALAPDLIWLDTNRAHALMLRKRTREARLLYLMHKGKTLARLIAEVRDVLSESAADAQVTLAEMRELAAGMPALARAFIALHHR
jgi:tetratricopeptide (TPR) repeat protein